MPDLRTFVLDARTATSHFPGIGRYVTSLANAIGPQLSSGERLWVLYDPRQPSPWGLGEIGSGRVEWAPLPLSPFSARAQWVVPRRLRSLGADVYHSPYYVMPYRTASKTVLTIYDLVPQRMPHAVSWPARLLFPSLTRLALRSADHVMTISEATQRDLLASYGWLDSSLSVVPLAASSRFEPQSSVERDRVREQYRLPRQFVLYVGSNKPHKNLLRLVEAWQQLADRTKYRELQLVVAGAWDERYSEPRRFVHEQGMKGCTRFLGPVKESDLPGLYAAATVFVFPSLDEGFGLPVIEAMACGTPVVCSRIPSLEEIVGDGALCFDPLSTVDMASQIERCLEDPALCEALSERGRVEARRYSWTLTAQRTLAIYRRVAEERDDDNVGSGTVPPSA